MEMYVFEKMNFVDPGLHFTFTGLNGVEKCLCIVSGSIMQAVLLHNILRSKVTQII